MRRPPPGNAVRLQGKTVPVPTAADDQKFFKYDAAANAFVLSVGSPGGDPSLGGDLSGVASNALVNRLKGKDLPAVPGAGQDGQFLQWNNSGNAYVFAAPSVSEVPMGGDVSGLSSAASVDRLKGKGLPAAPGAGQDGLFLQWSNSGNAYVFGGTPLLTAIAAKTANYTLTLADAIILGDAAAGAITMTLPAAAIATARMFIVKKIDATANAVTIAASGAETIDGAATAAIIVPWTALPVVSNGTAWYLV